VLKLLLKFLPEDKRTMIELAVRIVSSLDTPEERWAAINYAQEALKDGRMTVSEWARLGSILGILKGKH
jgi:hypothetical protein